VGGFGPWGLVPRNEMTGEVTTVIPNGEVEDEIERQRVEKTNQKPINQDWTALCRRLNS
jgi:hypothetical protein